MIEKTLYLDFLECTEEAALQVYNSIGNGDKNYIDELAVNAMRKKLNKINFGGEINVSEGIKDNAPTFLKNEKVGLQNEVKHSLVIDPIDGTTQASKDGSESMSIMAISEKDSFLFSDAWYMWKFAFGRKIKDNIPQYKLQKIIHNFAKIEKIDVAIEEIYKYSQINQELKFTILDRPRHKNLIDAIRFNDCKVRLIQDCDVSSVILTNNFDDSNIYVGIGGYTEGLLAAAAQKCLGGEFCAMLCNEKYEIDNFEILFSNDLVKLDSLVCITGILNGRLLKGIKYDNNINKLKLNSLLLGKNLIKFIDSYYI